MIDPVDVESAKAGNRIAIARVVAGCRNYVRRQVRAQARPDIADDLEQAGMLGVLRAIDRFDPTRGAKFLSAAKWSIQDEIQQERRRIDSDGMTGASHRRRIKAAKDKASRDHAEANGKEPPAVKGADVRSESERRRLEDRPLRLATPLRDHAPPVERDIVDHLDGKTAEALLSRLPSRQRTIVERRYLRDQSWDQIAEDLGIGVSLAKTIAARTLETLRRRMS